MPLKAICFFIVLLKVIVATGQDVIQHGPDEVYQATNVVEGRDGRLFLSTTGGLYYSDDDGESWRLADHFLNNIYVEPLMAIDRRTGDLYLAEEGGMMYSTDNGASFRSPFLILHPDHTHTQALAHSGDTLWMGTAKGLIYFKGMTEPIDHTVIPALANKSVTSVHVDGKTIVAGTSNDGVCRSVDGGLAWSAINNGLPAGFPVAGILIEDEEWYAFGSQGIFYSLDNGGTWQPKGNGITAPNIYGLTAAGNALYAATDSYDNVWLLEDGSDTWQLIDDGVPGSNGAMLFIWADDDDVLVGGWRGVYKRHSGERTFKPAYKGITDAFAVRVLNAASDGTLWAIASNTGIYKMAPGESMFTPFLRESANYGVTPLMGDTLAVINDYRLRFYDVITGQWKGEYTYVNVPFPRVFAKAWGGMFLGTHHNGVFKYAGNDTWQPFNTGLDNLTIVDIVYHRGRILVATDDGLYFRGVNDNKWTTIKFYGISTPTGVRTMLVEGDFIVVAGLNDKTYMSLDNGATWSQVEDLRGHRVTAFTSSEGHVYTAVHSDIFVSSVDKLSWKPVALATFAVTGMLAANDRIYVAEIERGIWSVPRLRFFRQAQQIDVSAIPTTVNLGEPTTLHATATSGLPVTYLVFFGPATMEGDVLTITSDEDVVLEASVAGNDAFQPGRRLITFKPPNILAAENEAGVGIAVFPVPTQSKLYVQGPEDEEMTATVVDGMGKILGSQRFRGMAEFEMEGYAKGVYLVRVERPGAAPHCRRVLKY